MNILHIPKVTDFELKGDGSASAWQKAEWQALTLLASGKSTYLSRFKCIYSDQGLYVLFDGEDRKLTCTPLKDFDDLFREDVFEFFLWTDESKVLYFEYEISPLGAELPILVPNHNGKAMGWRPWHYEGGRKTRTAVSIRGGPQAPGAEVTGWSAEVFMPFVLLTGLGNVPPQPGTRWRANFYRIDYDTAPDVSYWAWNDATGPSFHNYPKYGTIVFS